MKHTVQNTYEREVLVAIIESLGEGMKSPSGSVAANAYDTLKQILDDLKS